MARPKEFDRDEALLRAQDVFWRQGYAATTTEDLRRAMNIGRQSFYDTFVGKREAFLEVLQRYNDAGVASVVAQARAAKSPFAALERLLFTLADEDASKRALGCLGVSATCELGTADPDVAAIGAASRARLEKLMLELLREAKERGEVRANVDERAAARQLHATILGMKVLAKGGTPPAFLRDVATSALAGLAAS
jgi:AcrR family transcriptional regulator